MTIIQPEVWQVPLIVFNLFFNLYIYLHEKCNRDLQFITVIVFNLFLIYIFTYTKNVTEIYSLESTIFDKFYFPKNSPQKLDQRRHSEPYSLAILSTQNKSKKQYLLPDFSQNRSKTTFRAVFTGHFDHGKKKTTTIQLCSFLCFSSFWTSAN